MSAGVRVLLKPISPAGEGLRLDLVGEDKLTGGIASWGTINRPRRRDAVEFTGTRGLSYVLPLLLDGMETTTGHDTSVEPACRAILKWAGDPTKKTGQPTVLKATGPLQTPETVRWVISDIDWGAKVRNTDGKRVQQYVTLTLVQHTEATVRRSPAKNSRDRLGQG